MAGTKFEKEGQGDEDEKVRNLPGREPQRGVNAGVRKHEHVPEKRRKGGEKRIKQSRICGCSRTIIYRVYYNKRLTRPPDSI